MSLWDSIGEGLSGLTDAVFEGGEKFVDLWVQNEADKTASAAPEENRVPDTQKPAEQPTGKPIFDGFITGQNAPLYIGGGILVLVLIMVMIFAVGRK